MDYCYYAFFSRGLVSLFATVYVVLLTLLKNTNTMNSGANGKIM